jgi:ABC-2 type transport system permease protein
VKNNTLAVLNHDLGRESIELIQRLGKAQAFTKFIYLQNDKDLKETIEEQRALVAIQFPEDFSRKLAAGTSPSLQAVLDGRRSNSGQIAFSYVQQIVQDYMKERNPTQSMAPAISTTIVRHWFNPSLNFKWFIVPSLIAVITTASSLIVTSLSVAREREQGTFDQLLVSPLTPGMIMLGKAAPALIVGSAQGTIILLAGVFVFQIPFQGSLLLLYGSMICYILALVGFGLAISSICATQQQAFLGVFCFMMPAVLLSGFSAPIENMPHWLQVVTYADPLRYFVFITKGLFLKDLGWRIVWSNVWPMIVIAIVTLSIADVAFRRRLG